MKLSKLTPVLAAMLLSGSWALAQSATESPDPAATTVSRAEVLAELQIWTESGLAALEGGEESFAYTPRHDAAMARYEVLRTSPAFAALVQRIAQRRGERVLMASVK